MILLFKLSRGTLLKFEWVIFALLIEREGILHIFGRDLRVSNHCFALWSKSSRDEASSVHCIHFVVISTSVLLLFNNIYINNCQSQPTIMHIKQITISNFRSFRQQPEIQPFTAGMNAVVGRNGSGKSNLFDAVQFCLLGPRFANLRQVRSVVVYCMIYDIVIVVLL